MLNEQALIERIASALADGIVVPVLGAGCSARQTDEAGHLYEGFPLASEFASRMSNRYSYLRDVTDFYDTAVLIESHEGPSPLIQELKDSYSPSQRLPAYETLALLPFDTVVTFNFDEALEGELSSAGRHPSIIITDEDVPLSRRRQVTVVKPHGTVGRGATLRATRGRVMDFDNDCPLVRSLLEVLLADRAALFIGYGFGDQDLVGAVRRVRSWTRGTYRRSTAVVRKASASLRAELNELKIDVIEGTAVDVLGAVAAEYINRDRRGPEDSERWRAHPLFRELMSIRGRPTETQVVEALLTAASDRHGKVGVKVAAEQAVEAAHLCLMYRPNFASLQHVEKELTTIAASASDEEAWRHWNAYVERRRIARLNIADKASMAIEGAERLLIYSQSQRVMDLLLDLEPRRRSRISLIIPECRSKSPEPFQNALLMAEGLRAGGFASIEFVTDVVGLHLLLNGQVDMVLMGAHKVFKLNAEDDPVAVVNAVGADAISLIAEHADVPVVFVFEDEKIVYVESVQRAREAISFDPECDIGVDLEKMAMSSQVTCRQIGYDLVPWRSNTRAVIGITGG